MKTFRSIASFFLILSAASAQVLKLQELNTEQIRALDRAKTAIIIPGGILEQHGPYLPSGTDTFYNERMARDLADKVAAKPGWTAVMFPTLVMGVGSANVIGYKYSFPASYDVRFETLRSVYMDYADALGAQGFKWIFVVHNHGAPWNHRALNEAGDYFHDSYGGRMVHLLGYLDVYFCCPTKLPEQQLKENGFSVHADTGEHATTLVTRPDLVAPGFKTARTITGRDFAHLIELAQEKDWPGYFGAPKYATAALGHEDYSGQFNKAAELMLKLMNGFDPSGMQRYSDMMHADKDVMKTITAGLAHEAKLKKQQEDWLAKRAKATTAKPATSK